MTVPVSKSLLMFESEISFIFMSEPTAKIERASAVHTAHVYEHDLSTFSEVRLKSLSCHSYTAPSIPADTSRVSSDVQ